MTERKFKVGDRVVSLDGKYAGAGSWPNGVVAHIGIHFVEVDFGDGHLLNHYRDELKLASECSETPHYTKDADGKLERLSSLYPKYYKDVSGIDEIDVYAVHSLFGVEDTSGAIQHASKKLLLSGVRTGGKSKFNDIREARDTLSRWLELNSHSAD